MTEALRFFESVADGSTSASILRKLRPSPVSAADRAEALLQIPQESVLKPTAREQKQLDSLETVLRYHEREQIFAVTLIDVPMATAKLHGRAFVLISRPTLQLLSVPELQATVAHEMGHEYFWDEYAPLLQQNDTHGLQTLELKCDGVAALTLVALGVDASHLYRAIEKIGRFNGVPRARWGNNGYPHPRDRERFIRELLQMINRANASNQVGRALSLSQRNGV